MYCITLLISLLSLFNAPDDHAGKVTPALYLSTNQGATWTDFTTGISAEIEPRNLVEEDGDLYLSTHRHGVFKLAENTDTWVPLRKGLPFGAEFFLPTSLAVKGKFLTLGTYQHGTYVSRDGGKSWRPATRDVTRCARTLLYTTTALLAGTETGVFQSFDNGDTWTRMYDDRSSINVLARLSGRLYLASQNGMGTVEKGAVVWSATDSDWALLRADTTEEHVYFRNFRGEIFRSADGFRWENQPAAAECINFNNLTEARWRGFQPKLPAGEKEGNVYTTSRGWVAVMTSGGC